MAGKEKTPAAPLAVATEDELEQYKGTLTPEEQAEFDAFMGEHGKDGKENIKGDDIIMPRIALLQDLSPQVKERKAHAGEFFNIISDVNHGEHVDIVPLMFYTSRMLFDSPNPGASIECVARDGERGTKYGECAKCPKRQFTTDPATGKSVQPACTEFKNLLVIPRNEEQDLRETPPAAFSAKRASIGVMRTLLTRMQNMRHNGREVAMYSHIWRITSIEEKATQGSYFVPKFEDMGMITNVPLLRYFQSMYQGLKDSVQKFNIAEEPDEQVKPDRSTVLDADFKPAGETDY